MTLGEFRKTRTWADDLCAAAGVDLGEPTPGFIYAGGLTIEAPAGGAGPAVYRLPCQGDYHVSENLRRLEGILYVAAKREGWI